MWQRGNLFAQNTTVFVNIGCAHLQKIVEGASDHMAHFDFRSGANGIIEGLHGEIWAEPGPGGRVSFRLPPVHGH